MIDLNLTSNALDEQSVSVGYQCPCGCSPAVTYHHHQAVVTEGCCCGNQMAVGPDAPARLEVREGFEVRVASVSTPWRQHLPVAWAIGPSTHPSGEHEHPEAALASDATDPVCGMREAPADAVEKRAPRHTRWGRLLLLRQGLQARLP